MSTKEVKQVSDDKQALTAHFIQTLPPLLEKYLPDHEKIANLMTIPQYFDLEIYTTSRQEKNLEKLLNLIREIVDKHSDTEALEACAKTLETLCDDKFAIYSRCDIARSRLLEMITNQYMEVKDDYSNLLLASEEAQDDEMFLLNSKLKKVECFYACHNMSQHGIWQGKLSRFFCSILFRRKNGQLVKIIFLFSLQNSLFDKKFREILRI